MKPGTRKLSEVARHVVVPDGITSTGYPAVRDKLEQVGIVHDDWQQGLGRLALGKRADGKYAATVGGVVLSIPRQVGKTFTVGTIIFALCLLFPGLTVIWTAHHTRTSDETFGAMQGIAGRAKIRAYVAGVRRANGQQAIEFRNGSRILFGAREQGFGRGFAEVDVEVFDEAQILTQRALEDMVAATNQSKHPAGALLFYMGTPPRPVDPGEAFTDKRRKALAGATNMVYVELSADSDADPDDRAQWAKANPSFPARTPVESIERIRENVGSDEGFMREGLGIWDDDSIGDAAIPFPLWQRLADLDSAAVGPVRLSLEVSQDRKWACVGAAGLRSDGSLHVQVAENHRGTDWVVETVAALAAEHGGKVALSPNSPAGKFVAELESAGVTVIPVPVGQYAAACGAFFDAVAQSKVHHLSQPELDAAVRGAKRRASSDAWVFDRRRSSIDISPLAAVTLAAWSATTLALPPRNAGRGRVIALT